MDPVSELERLIDALGEARVEYALCGGLALAVHGYPRATVDIDLLVRADAVEQVIAVAATTELMALGLLVVNHELEPVWSTRVSLQSGARTLIVVSRDGLATMKRIAGRKQDLADLAKLEGSDDETQ